MLRIRCVFNVKSLSSRLQCRVDELCGLNILNHARAIQHDSNPWQDGPEMKKIRKNIKSAMDPSVEALEEKLIYCDHLHFDYIRLGHSQYTKIKNSIDYTVKTAQISEMLNTPTNCISLQYLKNDDVDKRQESSEESIQEEISQVKPVHMPFSTPDKVEHTETNKPPKDNTSLDDTFMLNERYVLLYEKYLEKKALLNARGLDMSLAEFLNDLKHNQNSDDNDSNEKKDGSWMKDYEEFNDANYAALKHPDGTPIPDSPITAIPCGGCGALLHCKDPSIPGYLPSELLSGKDQMALQNLICKRCHFLKLYNTALKVNVSPDEYSQLLQIIKTKKCAVIIVVDLADFPSSIWHELKSVLHPLTVLFVVGNKVDLLPKDHKQFDTHVMSCLKDAVLKTGVKENMIKYVGLVSAQTGYGIEELINKIQHLWGVKGDIYMIGCTNVGKSSLFNALLKSDLCKSQASDVVQRATTSPWPGTTLNLLKFPILNPQKWRMAMRSVRLKQAQQNAHASRLGWKQLFKQTENIKFATLRGNVTQTFKDEDFTQNPFAETSHKGNHYIYGLDENDPVYAQSRWCYDTPGTMQSDQILNLFTTEELLQVLPQRIILPRTFIFYPGQTAFLAGVGRLDFLEGQTYMLCTMFASDKLPFTMCRTQDADELYKELLYTKAFAVPTNDPCRLEQWPGLKSQDFEVTTGIHNHQSCADIVLSSAGWFSLTPIDNRPVKLRAWTPEGRGLYLRTPSLLPFSVHLRGCRIDGTPLYTKGRQVYVGP